jgi:hypothetical protein
MCKQRKERSSKRPNESINRNSAVGVEAIAVDKIAHTLPERYHTTEPEERDRKDLRYPANVRIAGPREPEEAGWQRNGTEDHGRQPLFGYDFTVLGVRAGEVCGGAVGDAGCA